MQDRVQKVKEEVQKGKEKYECALQELNSYNPKYMEDMTVVFDKCQEMEAQRLQFFKDILFTVHKYLNISQDPTYAFFINFFFFFLKHNFTAFHLFANNYFMLIDFQCKMRPWLL